MARQLRQFKYNTFIHVFNKLNPELWIKTKFLKEIKEIIRISKNKFHVHITNCRIMNTHFHMCLLFEEKYGVTVSKYMHWLGTVLAIFVNKTLRRHGSVFIDRYKSKLVLTKRYFRKLFNYIKENMRKRWRIGSDPYFFNNSSSLFHTNQLSDGITAHYRQLIPIANIY
mgnify:CR=1 FL=1